MLGELVTSQGGKFGLLSYLKDQNSDFPFPPYFVKKYGDNDKIGSYLNALEAPYIARTSHRQELWGFSGVFDSIGYLENEQDVSDAINEIRKQVENEDVIAYAKSRGVDLERQIHVGVQEQIKSKYTGFMMRHPNIPELLIVNLRFPDTDTTLAKGIDIFFVYDENDGKFYNKFPHIPSSNEVYPSNFVIDEIEMAKAIDFFKNSEHILEKTEELNGYSLQMEVAFSPLYIHQVRPFKLKQIADFSLGYNPKNLVSSSYSFGITPKDGIVLPAVKGFSIKALSNLGWDLSKLVKSDIFDEENYFELTNQIQNLNSAANTFGYDYLPGQPKYRDYAAQILELLRIQYESQYPEGYIFFTENFHKDKRFADIHMSKTKVFVDTHASDFLTHQIFRQMQNFEFSILNSRDPIQSLYPEFQSGDYFRVISDGRRGLIIKE